MIDASEEEEYFFIRSDLHQMDTRRLESKDEVFVMNEERSMRWWPRILTAAKWLRRLRIGYDQRDDRFLETYLQYFRDGMKRYDDILQRAEDNPRLTRQLNGFRNEAQKYIWALEKHKDMLYRSIK